MASLLCVICERSFKAVALESVRQRGQQLPEMGVLPPWWSDSCWEATPGQR